MATPAREKSSVAYLIAFPLLLVPFALYNMIGFLLNLDLNTTVFSLPLLNGRAMAISMGDSLVILGVLLLYIEILKATRLSLREMMDHVLSLVLFVGMVVEFLMVTQAATSTFLILLVLSFIDVIAGLTVSIRAAHRDIAVETHDGAA